MGGRSTAADRAVGEVRGTVAGGVRWKLGGGAAVQSVQYVVSMVLFGMVDPAEVGLMALSLVVVEFLDQFVVMGTSQAVVQRRKVDNSFLGTVFTLNMLLALAFAAVLAVSAGSIADLVSDPAIEGAQRADRLASVLRLLAVLFPLTALGLVHRSLLQRAMTFERIVLADAVKAFVYGAVAIPLAWNGLGVWALAWGTLAGTFAGSATAFLASPWRSRPAFSIAHVKELWRFCSNLMGASLTHYLLSNADRVIIKRFLGAEALGYYFFAHRLVLFPAHTLTLNLQPVLTSAFSRLQDDLPQLRAKFAGRAEAWPSSRSPC